MARWTQIVAIPLALSAAFYLGSFFSPRPATPHAVDATQTSTDAPIVDEKQNDDSLRQLREENDALRRELDAGRTSAPRAVDRSHDVDVKSGDIADSSQLGLSTEQVEADPENDETQIGVATAASPKPTKQDGLESSDEINRELKAMPISPTTDWPEPKRRTFLSRMTLRDPLKTIDKMSRVNIAKDRYLSALYGGYRGPIRFIAKGNAGRIRLDLREFDGEEPNRWLVLIEVTDGRGKKSRQTGGLDMLRSLDPKSPGYAIRSSETSFLQLFYREAERRFIGNYYEKKNNSTYVRLGTVELNRVPDS